MELLLNQETFQSENFFSFSLTVQIYIFPHHQICFFLKYFETYIFALRILYFQIFPQSIYFQIFHNVFSLTSKFTFQNILNIYSFKYICTYFYITVGKKSLKKKRRGDAAAIKPLTVKQSVEGGIGKTLCPENHYLTILLKKSLQTFQPKISYHIKIIV